MSASPVLYNISTHHKRSHDIILPCPCVQSCTAPVRVLSPQHKEAQYRHHHVLQEHPGVRYKSYKYLKYSDHVIQ